MQIAHWVNQLYVGPRWWNPVEPDLLTEYLVADKLVEIPGFLGQVLLVKHENSLVRSLGLFARAVMDYAPLADALQPALSGALVPLCRAAVKQTTSQPDLRFLLGTPSIASALGRILQGVELDELALREAVAVMPAGPNQILGPLGLALATQLVRHHRRLADANLAASEPDLARSLVHHARQLGMLGRGGEALTDIRQAVIIYRRLVEFNSDAYEARLAQSLSILALTLAQVGRRDEALPLSEEVVTIYRRLAAAHPAAAHEPELARSLGNHALRLVEAGRQDEALPLSEEAVTIYRRAAAHEPELAALLGNHALRLVEAGRQDEALPLSEEAVTIYRRLAAANPAAHEPELAASLSNHALRLVEAGRQDEALPLSEEAVTIYRRLADANPAAHEPNLAQSRRILAWIRP